MPQRIGHRFLGNPINMEGLHRVGHRDIRIANKLTPGLAGVRNIVGQALQGCDESTGFQFDWVKAARDIPGFAVGPAD